PILLKWKVSMLVILPPFQELSITTASLMVCPVVLSNFRAMPEYLFFLSLPFLVADISRRITSGQVFRRRRLLFVFLSIFSRLVYSISAMRESTSITGTFAGLDAVRVTC